MDQLVLKRVCSYTEILIAQQEINEMCADGWQIKQIHTSDGNMVAAILTKED